MKHRHYLSTMAIAALISFTACKDDYTEDHAFDEDIKTELVDKSELPEWLADYVSYLEYVPEGQELPKDASGIYRFEWFDRTFYNIYSPNQSTLYSHLYTPDGMPVNLTETYTKSFADHAVNWTIVYVMKPTKEMPANVIYPAKVQNPEHNDSTAERLFSFKGNPNEFRPWSHDFYVVNSEEQFRILFGNSATLPDIDFNQYTLVIGVCDVPKDFRQIRQELNTDSETPILQVYFEKEQDFNHEIIFNTDPTLVWALYPKFAFEKGKARVWWNNLEDGSMYIKGGFCQPTEDECAVFSLGMYTYGSDNKRLEKVYKKITIQIPGDGTIRGKAGSTPFTGKIELSDIRVEDAIYTKGEVKIKLDNVVLSDEKDEVALLFLKHIEEVTHFAYILGDEIDLLTETDSNRFFFFRQDNY